MVDFVGDILRNSYNQDAAQWVAPEVTDYAVSSKQQTTGGGMDPLARIMIQQYKDGLKSQYGHNKWARDMTGTQRRELDRMRDAGYRPGTTSTIYSVGDKKFGGDQAAAQAYADEQNAAAAAEAQNPFLSEGQFLGLPGFSANELVQSGYLDNVDQASGLVFDPQSSYAAQQAIALDRFGDDALTRMLTQAAAPGADISGYATRDRLDPLVQQMNAGIDLTDDASTVYDFGGYLNDEAAQGIVDQIVAGERQGARDNVNTLGGFGFDDLTGTSQYARDTFNSGLDDALISDILGGQQQSATNALDRALGYGQISQGGYDAALANLGNQRSAAESRIGGYTDSILEGYRGTTDQDIADLYGTIGGLKLGQDFNAEGAVGDITSGAQERLGGFEGALREQIGGEQFFDIGQLLAEGQKGSGIYDPIKSGTASGFFGNLEDREKQRQQQRGLGSQGSF